MGIFLSRTSVPSPHTPRSPETPDVQEGANSTALQVMRVVVDYLDPHTLVAASLACRDFHRLIKSETAHDIWRDKANRLSSNQQRRLRRLCDAYASGAYWDIARAQAALKPQDVLSFPDLGKSHRQALGICLDKETEKLYDITGNKNSLIWFSEVKRARHIVEELSHALCLSPPANLHARVESFVHRSLATMVAERILDLREGVSRQRFMLSCPSYRSLDYKKAKYAITLLNDPAERQHWQHRIQTLAEEERQEALTLFAQPGVSADGSPSAGTSDAARWRENLRLWEQTNAAWAQ